MVAIAIIFGIPMIIAAALISPLHLHDLLYGLLVFSIMGAVLAPIVGWPSFLIMFFFPTEGDSRLAAVFRFWWTSALLLGAVVSLLIAALDYSPAHPGPSPTAGFLLGGFSVSMLLSFGIWGAFSAILPVEFIWKAASVTGFLLFLALAIVGYAIAMAS